MRVNSNGLSQSSIAQFNLGLVDSLMERNLSRLSTGYKLNQSQNGSSVQSTSSKLSDQIKLHINSITEDDSNIQKAITTTQVGESALNDINSCLSRMSTLAAQASNDTVTEDVRHNIQIEVNDLSRAINQIVHTAEFNNNKLLDGTYKETFNVGQDSITMAFKDMSTDALGLTDNKSGLDLTCKESASKSYDKIDKAISAVSSETAVIQSYNAHFQRIKDHLSTNTEVSGGAAQDLLQSTKHLILTQSASSMLAQGNQTPQRVMDLLSQV
ncbi:MAG: hypothetical protein ABFC94_18610 [Syntrophomonas sp.]